MTFENQINALTGLSLGDVGNPSLLEANQYLQDGVREVINRIIRIVPEEAIKFSKTTHDNNNSGIVYTGRIISVMREHDSTTILRECEAIPPGRRYDATDRDSIYYKTKENPAYYILGSTDSSSAKIYGVPAAESGDLNDVIVTQVTYDTGVATTDTSIDNFATEYEYLVVLYSSIKLMEHKINKLNSIEEDIELAKSLESILASLKADYEGAFNRMIVRQPKED